MFKTKKFWYILLFAILYLIVAFSSFFHACSFFALANNSWMSIILAFAFEIGQAAVLFSLLTSAKDRSRIMPWVLMTMFTLVQVIGNVFSSYKHIMLNSVENLKYFKEPIFIWTQLPDQEATVIVTYIIGALLPIAALLLTSMITNYLTDEEEKQNDNKSFEEVSNKSDEIQKQQDEIDRLRNELVYKVQEIDKANKTINNEKRDIEKIKSKQNEIESKYQDQKIEKETEITEDNIETPKDIQEEQLPLKKSHFINL